MSSNRPHRALRWCGQVFAWCVLIGAGLVLTVAVAIPRIAGATPYRIATPSMRPTLAPDTLVVVRPVAADRIRLGDVITYQIESGRPTTATHRVVGLGAQGKELVFRTRGDANPSSDPDLVRAVQVRGVAWYSVPWVGRMATLWSGPQRAVATQLLAGALALYAAGMFVAAFRARRQLEREPA